MSLLELPQFDALNSCNIDLNGGEKPPDAKLIVPLLVLALPKTHDATVVPTAPVPRA